MNISSCAVAFWSSGGNDVEKFVFKNLVQCERKDLLSLISERGMGNAISHRDKDMQYFSQQFTESDLQSLRQAFDSMESVSSSRTKYVTESSFQNFSKVHGLLGHLLFLKAVGEGQSDNPVISFTNYLRFKAQYCKCSIQELNMNIFDFLDASKSGSLTREDLESCLFSVMESVLGNVESSSWFVSCLLSSAEFKSEDSIGTAVLSVKDYLGWIRKVPSVKKFLACILCEPLPGPSGRFIPSLNFPESLGDHILLNQEYAWHIMGVLDEKEWKEWTLLYHSGSHGLSFNSFMGKVRSAGKTVLICKDKGGAIFGGYASQKWDRLSDFYGDLKSFIFTLYPAAAIFIPSGSNSNVQWCAMNFTSESIPNGIGFGGQIGHFGLFLDAGFESGHSRATATFNNPVLSSCPRFEIESVECWGAKMDDSKSAALKGTILERFKEERAVLGLVGIATASHQSGDS